MVSQDTAPSARATFYAKLDAYAEEHPDWDAPELARNFAASLQMEDAALVEELLTMDASARLAWVYRARFGRNRHQIFAALDLPSLTPVPPLESEDESPRKSVYERITQWRQFDGGTSRLFMEMTAAQHLSARAYHMGRIANDAWQAEIHKRVAGQLGPEQTTSDRFTVEEVADLITTVKKDMNRGNLRFKIEPVHTLPRTPAISGQAHGWHAERSEADRGMAAE